VKTSVITRRGSLVELEVRATKEMTDLDRTGLAHLHELGQVGAELQCRLLIHDSHLIIQLDEPELP